MATPSTLCKSFSEFEKILKNIQDRYGKISPDGKIAEEVQTKLYDKNLVPEDHVMEYIKGGIISIMAAWEAFIVNILEEAYGYITYECTTCEDPSQCICPDKEDKLNSAKKWSGFEGAVKHAIDQKFVKDKKPNVDTAYKWLSHENSVRKLLIAHRKISLNTQFTPVFTGDHRIDSTFKSLFYPNQPETDRSLSKILIEMGRIKFDYKLNKQKDCKLEIRNKQTLCDMLALFYGIRCILAHGNSTKTLTSGVLSKFPSASDVTKDPNPLYQAKELHDKIGKAKDVDKKIAGDEQHEQMKKYTKVTPNVAQLIEYMNQRLPQAGEHTKELNNAIKELESVKDYWPKYNHRTDGNLPEIYAYFDLYKVFCRFKTHEREAWINYLHFERLGAFILSLAECTMLALAKHICDCVGLKIWGYPSGE